MLLTGTAILASCAQETATFPSLAPRPIEQTETRVLPRPMPLATPDSGLDRQLSTITKQLADADSTFAATANRVASLTDAARAAGVGSAAWLDAQAALADLDAIHAQSTAALSALDALAIARASKLEPAYPSLTTLQNRGATQAEQESSAIAELQKRLPAA